MKTCFSASLSLLVLCGAASLVGQDELKPVRQTSFIESRQGNHPDGPAAISKNDTLICMLVEVYDETHQASTACVIKFKDGSQRVLNHGEFMKSAVDSEVSLQCSGRVPRRCIIEVNDPVNQPPVHHAER